jgi:hypothetical protein
MTDLSASPEGFGVIRNEPLEGSERIAELGLFPVDAMHPGNLTAVCFWLKRGFEFEARPARPWIVQGTRLTSNPGF